MRAGSRLDARAAVQVVDPDGRTVALEDLGVEGAQSENVEGEVEQDTAASIRRGRMHSRRRCSSPRSPFSLRGRSRSGPSARRESRACAPASGSSRARVSQRSSQLSLGVEVVDHLGVRESRDAVRGAPIQQQLRALCRLRVAGTRRRSHRHPSVDDQRDARHEARILTEQEADGRRHVVHRCPGGRAACGAQSDPSASPSRAALMSVSK